MRTDLPRYPTGLQVTPMIFIHHYQDSERDEKPPKNIQRIARRLAETGGSAVTHTPAFVSAKEPRMEDVTTNPESCGSDYWEIVIEDSDL